MTNSSGRSLSLMSTMTNDEGTSTSSDLKFEEITPSTISPSTDSYSFREDSCSYSASSSHSSSESMPLSMLLLKMAESEDDISFAEHGYVQTIVICNTLQGKLFQGEICRATNANKHYGDVGSLDAIKRTEKLLHNQGISMVPCNDDEDEFAEDITFCVDEDVVKEGQILKQLTCQSQPAGDYIAKYVDFFEDSDYYYLVMEYVNGITLQSFVDQALIYLADGRLSRSSYTVVVKYIMWQLITTIQWMQDVHQCVHLDLNLSNIMLTSNDSKEIFIESSDGQIRIHSDVSIKLVDFGVAEMYRNKSSDFECDKQSLSLDHCQSQCPNQIEGQSYNAKAHDMWCIGHILFELMTGSKLYDAEDTFHGNIDGGLKALYDGTLPQYLTSIGLLNCFMMRSFSVLKGLLTVDEDKRWTATKMMQHSWFKNYHQNNTPSVVLKNERDVVKMQSVSVDKELSNLLLNFSFYDD